MDGILAWLSELPPAALYGALALIAAVENVFPPFPADTVVAFGAFLAARGEGTLLGVFLATWFGNVAGAMLMYALGRWIGTERLQRRLGGAKAVQRVRDFHARYGAVAIFLSRFLPAVRAVVPPVAGALRVSAPRAAVLMGAASAIWYGIIAVLGFRIGDDWERLSAAVTSSTRIIGLVAAGIVIVAALVVWLRRRGARDTS